MTRLYIQPSFVDSCSDHGEWSGGNGQYRGDRSVEVVPTYINGRANVRAFSDEAIADRREKKKTSIPLIDRVLPQQRRVRVLTEQLIELEQAYKSGEYDINEYSLLRNVVARKRDRAQILYEKAIAVKSKEEDTEYTIENDELLNVFSYEIDFSVNSHRVGWFRLFCDSVDDLSSDNILRPFCKKACILIQRTLELSQAVRKYTNEV